MAAGVFLESVEPKFDGRWEEPRFAALVRRMGLASPRTR